jgi:DNA repair protein RecO (recombination protein O)
VVNELFLIQGKNLDKLVQAETVRSFPGIAIDLARLTASQYLAELVLCQALTGQPQSDIFTLLIRCLQQLEKAVGVAVLMYLSRGIFDLLVLAGIAPELERCSLTQIDITPDFGQSNWRIGFSAASGGLVDLAQTQPASWETPRVKTPSSSYARLPGQRSFSSRRSPTPVSLNAEELRLLRSLRQPLSSVSNTPSETFLWQRIERILRQYAEYHFDRSIQSATLIDSCFPQSAVVSMDTSQKSEGSGILH